MPIDAELTVLKGVGEKTAAAFRSRGIVSIGGLLHYYPRSYTRFDPVSSTGGLDFPDGSGQTQTVSLLLTVAGNARKVRLGRRSITHFTAADEEGEVRLTFFNMPYIASGLPHGTRKVFRGIVKKTADGKLFMEHPQIFRPEEYASRENRLIPHYAPVNGVSDEKIRKMTGAALEYTAIPEEYLQEEELSSYTLIPIGEAIRAVHFPASEEELAAARKRLVFDEFMAFMVSVIAGKADQAVLINDRPMLPTAEVQRLMESLPYRLTASQQAAYRAIEADLCGHKVMNRLLQGDVGSGKTIVAFLAMLLCASNGRQSALMAPTEVLAVQHMKKLSELSAKYRLPVVPVLLTGSVKGKAREKALADIAAGNANAVIGTHALIQDPVTFHDLSLVITDEQHRFGVRQRESLSGKGKDVPILVMSATPIPRTLAMIVYGDLDTSLLTEKPGERLPVRNLAMPDSKRGQALRFMLDQVDAGRQAYIICPAVEKTEGMELNNVEEYSAALRNSIPEKYRISVLHGRMKPAEKSRVMETFSSHLSDILVSTTVIEVGIDVSNATVMIIENAERFGLSQLHQLRGRVGRGKEQSYCIFLYHSDSEQKPERLEVLEKTGDGFEIAEKDLSMRGPGDMLGTIQSGELQFALGDICSDREILYMAREYAEKAVSSGSVPSAWSAGSVDFRTI